MLKVLHHKYAEGPASQSMFYPDSSRLVHDTNTGFGAKRALAKQGEVPDVTLQLNRYPFFEAFKNQVPPLAIIGIEITLAKGNDLIFRDAAVAEGRAVVTSMILWVLKLGFNSEGRKWFFHIPLNNTITEFYKRRCH